MSDIIDPRNVGSMIGRVRYDFMPRLKAHLRTCPPGTTVDVRVVETRIETVEASFATAPPEQVLVVLYDIAPVDAPEVVCALCDGTGMGGATFGCSAGNGTGRRST